MENSTVIPSNLEAAATNMMNVLSRDKAWIGSFGIHLPLAYTTDTWIY